MNVLPLFVAIPLGAAFLTPILSKAGNRISAVLGLCANGFIMGLSIWIIQYSKDTIVYFAGGWQPIAGIPIGIAMVMDGLTVVMLLIINVVGFFAMLYSLNYMTRYTETGKYYTLFLLMMGGLNGVVLSGDLFNLFVFLEITAIASYSLVAFGVEAEELEASFKYQVLGGTASAMILLGIAVFYQLTGTLNLADASRVIEGIGLNPAVIFVGILFLVGFSLKAALMPFHAWLPDAHPSAPAPISAMLSGVVIKVLGVYTLIRMFFNIFGIGRMSFVLIVFLILGTLSMVAGAFLALSQKDFKRLLAYSSISQIGYVIFAFGLGTPLGFLGGLFHLINHASFKSLLFLNSGAVVYRTDNRDMEKMGGFSQRMPVTGTTSLMGSLSIGGIPPLGGFWSKLVIVIAAVESHHFILAGIAVLTSIITLAYYLKVQKMTFFGKLSDLYKGVKEVPVLMCVSMVTLAILSLGLGVLLLPQLRNIILDPAVNVIAGGLDYAKMVLGG
ncbi:NADH/ubiquinone/plastoquinone (complex I) [bacterium]|nr:NADH/ubiquinone/plastoquinone (complex I) [bacterium]